jgi:putative two-component system response regulator
MGLGARHAAFVTIGLRMARALVVRHLRHRLTLERDLAYRTEELRRSRAETIRRLATAIDLRDDITGSHSARTAEYAYAIARRLGLPQPRSELIKLAMPLQDIGKIALFDQILHKPGPLTEAEQCVMQTHTDIGHRLLSGSGEELLELAATIAWTHHERIDRTGYPSGLAGDRIPEAGRIAAVADVADALRSDRPYRTPYRFEQALDILLAQRGSQLDPHMVDALIRELRSRSKERDATGTAAATPR